MLKSALIYLSTMKALGLPARLLWALAGAWMLIEGINDVSTRSQSSETWREETSLMALGIRSQGSLKIGLGIFALGASVIGASGENISDTSALRDERKSSKKHYNINRDGYDMVVKLYQECSGAFDPDYDKANILARTILLRDCHGEDLAYFSSGEEGWRLVKLYK